MKADKKDKLKDILKLADTDKPKIDFTASVMNFIEADVQREAALKTALQKQEAEGPSFSFTANVMAGIQASRPQYVYKPIISKKVWYGIAAALLVILIVAGIPSGATQHKAAGTYSIATLISYTYVIPPIYAIAILAAAVLLTADYLVGRNKNKATHQTA